MAKKITAQELKLKIDRNEAPTILEALPFKYYRKAHRPGALNFPVEEGDALARKLIPNQKWTRLGYPVARGNDPQSQEESTPRMSCCG